MESGGGPSPARSTLHNRRMNTVTCPKCRAEMRSYERNGVTIEQCTECRGIFLDRGELEHLTAAEAKWSAPAAPAAPAAPQYQQQAQPPQYGYGHKRRKSFLEELFD